MKEEEMMIYSRKWRVAAINGKNCKDLEKYFLKLPLNFLQLKNEERYEYSKIFISRKVGSVSE